MTRRVDGRTNLTPSQISKFVPNLGATACVLYRQSGIWQEIHKATGDIKKNHLMEIPKLAAFTRDRRPGTTQPPAHHLRYYSDSKLALVVNPKPQVSTTFKPTNSHLISPKRYRQVPFQIQYRPPSARRVKREPWLNRRQRLRHSRRTIGAG